MKTKQPLTAHGFEDATTDEARIRAWWLRWPDAMIGLPTGKAIGAFVIDFDPYTDEKTGETVELGDLVKSMAVELGIIWPKTVATVTPRGGRHVFFKLPDGDPPGNRAGMIRRGIDVRGEGGYVIAPPSKRADGVAYQWVAGCAPGELELAIAPPALLDCIFRRGKWSRDAARAPDEQDAGAIREGPRQAPVDVSSHVRTYALAALASEAAKVASAASGERNDKLNSAAFVLGQLVAADGLLERVVRAELEDAASRCGVTKDDGLKSVHDTIDSGLKAARRSPRDLREIEAAAARRAASPGRRSGGGAAVRPAAAPQPHDRQEGSSASLAKDDSGASQSEAIAECSALDQSDTDNGKRLRIHFGDDLLVMEQGGVPGGDFLCWTGTHWDLDGGAAGAARVAQRIGDLIIAEADYLEATPQEARAIEDAKVAAAELKQLKALAQRDEVQKLRILQLTEIVGAGVAARSALNQRKRDRRRFGVSSKNGGRIEQMLKCAAPHMRRSPEDFNADPMLVATATHTLRFVRELNPECPDPDEVRLQAVVKATKEHRRADLITALVPVAYDPEFRSDRWRKFIERFQPDPEVRRTVQQFSGLGLLGMPIQRVMFHVGTGANGKSVFLETVMRVLGGSFAVGLPAESITGAGDRGAGAASPDLARLFGKRMLRVLELPAGKPLQIEVIKRLTGGEKIPVRTLFKGYFEFQPRAKAHMSGNDYPTFDGSDGGMRRRLIVIKWPVTIPDNEQRDIEEVVCEFMADAPDVLNWLIEGALDYLQNGLYIAPKALADTQEYFDEMNPVGQFVQDCVEAAPGETVQARPMYEAYVAWSIANARRPVSETRFGRTMKKMGIKRDDGRLRVYLDVRLHDVPVVERPEDHARPHHGADLHGI